MVMQDLARLNINILGISELTSDPAPLPFESALEASASDLDPQVVESPLQTDVVVPADSMPQESDPDAEAQEFPKKAGLGAPLRTPASVIPPQDPEVNIQAQLSLGGETIQGSNLRLLHISCIAGRFFTMCQRSPGSNFPLHHSGDKIFPNCALTA